MSLGLNDLSSYIHVAIAEYMKPLNNGSIFSTGNV